MAVSSVNSPVVLYSAPWVIPVTSPIIKNGAVAVKNGRIVSVGLQSDLFNKFPNSDVHTSTGVLMPGFVNSHMHLELSAYGVVSQDTAESTMCDWVRKLLHKRIHSTFSVEQIHSAANKCALEQYHSGVVALLDTGNDPLPAFTGDLPEICSLLEFLGPSDKATRAVLKILDGLAENTYPTGHAPYSTSPQLLQSIKKRTVDQGTVFSLHVEENPDESLLLFYGKGCFYDFLKERDALDGTFPLEEKKYQSVVDYLYKTQILDEKTLCVHCVYVTEEDIKTLARSKSHICLCPCSNRFLGLGEAPLEAFLTHNIVPALGTDSIASNPQLNMWQEIALIKKEHPTVSPETILAMATIAGAKAIGREADYGSLEAGKRSAFIAVEDKKISTAVSEKEVLETLTSIGNPKMVIHCQ